MSSKIALVVAVVLGVVAALAVKQWEEQQRREIIEPLEERYIWVAERNIPEGLLLDGRGRQHFTLAPIPKKYIRAGMLGKDDIIRYKEWMVTRSLEQGAPLLSNDLAPPLENQALNVSLVEPGYRAVTIPVDAVGSLAGMLSPGDRLDAVGTFQIAQDNTRRTYTVVLLDNVRVIALDDRTEKSATTDRRSNRYRTITLEVRPRDAMRLLNALQQGQVQFTLRHRGDTSPFKTGNRLVGYDILGEVREAVPHTDAQTGSGGRR